MGTKLPLRKGHSSATPHFRRLQTYKLCASVYCGQMAGWITIPVSTEVGLGPGDIVLDVDQLPPTERGIAAPPYFLAHVCCGQTAGLIRIPLGTDVGLGQGDIMLDGDPVSLAERGTAAPTFQPISVVAKLLDELRCHLVQR